ncbi:MAG: molybdopterin-synthase adenylyltransferase MoeB [Xanthomonadales bacterium]|nr:molybdopterin-synthase adenylyltransferase MoeB [Xanthomonadales bacterium]
MSLAQHHLQRLRGHIEEIDVREAARRMQAGALLLDVREADEQAAGGPAGAITLPRSALELRIEQHARPDQSILLLCAGGQRSLLAAADLHRLGYTQVSSVVGGFSAWQAAGLPQRAADRLDASERQRYGRQLILDEIGPDGQAQLQRARVLIVGAGGLGCPSALYLAAAGVGQLTLIDADRVELSNLHRQVLHGSGTLGRPKVESARERLLSLDPKLQIRAIEARLDEDNVGELVRTHDVIIDGSDNFATRYRLNAECVAQGKPLIYAAVQRFEAQVSVFWPAAAGGLAPCYRCLFPEPPPPEAAPNCAEAGVLGVVPGIVGLLQANECLKLICGFGELLTGRLLCFDARSARWRELQLPRDPDCPGCGPRQRPLASPSAEVCASGTR